MLPVAERARRNLWHVAFWGLLAAVAAGLSVRELRRGVPQVEAITTTLEDATRRAARGERPVVQLKDAIWHCGRKREVVLESSQDWYVPLSDGSGRFWVVAQLGSTHGCSTEGRGTKHGPVRGLIVDRHAAALRQRELVPPSIPDAQIAQLCSYCEPGHARVAAWIGLGLAFLSAALALSVLLSERLALRGRRE